MSKRRPIVLITGVTGFIGSHVCRAFLQNGGFEVRGTVRDLTDEVKIKSLRMALATNFK